MKELHSVHRPSPCLQHCSKDPDWEGDAQIPNRKGRPLGQPGLLVIWHLQCCLRDLFGIMGSCSWSPTVQISTRAGPVASQFPTVPRCQQSLVAVTLSPQETLLEKKTWRDDG